MKAAYCLKCLEPLENVKGVGDYCGNRKCEYWGLVAAINWNREARDQLKSKHAM